MAKTAILTKDGLVRYDSNIKDYIKDLTDDTIYIDPDETSSEIESADSVTSAKFVSYSNENSGLEVANVQDAIDEVNEKTDDINTYLQRNSSSKNLLKPTIASDTYGGVTITVNSDKSITLNGITTSGGLVTIGQVQLEADTEYIYSVNPSKNMPDGWFSQVTHRDGQSFVNVSTYGEDITFTNAGAALKSFIYFHLGVSGTVYDNITLYPMIRLSSIEDDTYQPYYEDTMSSINYLNDKVNYLSNELSTVSTSVDNLKYNVLERTDVVDNLSSTATSLPLSANQGKILNENIANVKTLAVKCHMYIVPAKKVYLLRIPASANAIILAANPSSEFLMGGVINGRGFAEGENSNMRLYYAYSDGTNVNMQLMSKTMEFYVAVYTTANADDIVFEYSSDYTS